jgi:hypothetical protein
MIGIEVTRDESTWLLEDRDTVLRMARIGQLGPADTLRETREGDFVAARDLEWLAGAFEGDPWDAWEELDGMDPEEAWAEVAVPVQVAEEPVEDTDLTTRKDYEREARGPWRPQAARAADPSMTLSVSFKPAGAPSTSPAPKSKAPAKSPPPLRTPPRPQAPPAMRAQGPGTALDPSMGQVIEFPNARVGSVRPSPLGSELPAALLQPLEVQDLVPNDPGNIRVHRAAPPEPPRSMAPWLVVIALILCLAAFGLSIYSIQRDAQWTSAQSRATPTAPAATPGAVPEPAAKPAAAVADDADLISELGALDAELRERIPGTPVDLGGRADGLASALLIELSNMKLGPVKVSAPVVSWTGARNDVVEVADVEVRLTSSGTIERELAAVGLVVGKYLQHYGFEIRKFSVIVTGQDGVSRKRQIEPDAARQLWSGRKDLYEFLTGR